MYTISFMHRGNDGILTLVPDSGLLYEKELENAKTAARSKLQSLGRQRGLTGFKILEADTNYEVYREGLDP